MLSPRRGVTARAARALGLLWLFSGGTACSTTPPPRGIEVVEPERPPPAPETIAAAQRRMRELEDYHGPVDGQLTAETRVALARFQRRAGLEVTGALDDPTLEALEARIPRLSEAPAPAPERPELPSAEALLAPEPARPQPPPAWLEPRLQDVAASLEEARREAARRLEAPDGLGPVAVAERVGEAERLLSEARRAGFDRIVEARLEAGYAPLPEVLLEALRQALFERNLLIRPEKRGWGRDEEEAVRWMERSLGLPQTGRPSLPLLEALAIDPLPIFGLGHGSRGRSAVQSGP